MNGSMSGSATGSATCRKPAADPVLVEIVRNGVMAVTEEMKVNLMRTAYNMIIYEALDFTVGIFTKEGDTVSIGLGLPMFIRGMSETVKAKIRHFGFDDLRPGDILLTNDSYITGSHLNHLTFTAPIFHEDELVGELGVAHELGDLLEDLLAGLVEGMGFAGEDELHWALGVVDHGRESLDVGKEEVGALVSGKAAGEADGEGVGHEELAEALEGFAGLVAALGLLDGAAADELEEIGLEAEVGLP